MTNSVSDVFSGLGLSAATGAPKKKELGEADFLRLMVSQLQNQDPLKPLDGTQFLGQLAQFSTVAGITDLNRAFGTLAGSLGSEQSLQASSLVGNRVLAPGSAVALGTSGEASGALDLPGNANGVTLQVLDASGATVRTVTLGAASAGLAKFSWDGITDLGVRAPAGIYTIRATGTVDGQPRALPTLVAARVDSVDLNGANGLTLNLAGLGPVAFNQVRQILPAGN